MTSNCGYLVTLFSIVGLDHQLVQHSEPWTLSDIIDTRTFAESAVF